MASSRCSALGPCSALVNSKSICLEPRLITTFDIGVELLMEFTNVVGEDPDRRSAKVPFAREFCYQHDSVRAAALHHAGTDITVRWVDGIHWTAIQALRIGRHACSGSLSDCCASCAAGSTPINR